MFKTHPRVARTHGRKKAQTTFWRLFVKKMTGVEVEVEVGSHEAGEQTTGNSKPTLQYTDVQFSRSELVDNMTSTWRTCVSKIQKTVWNNDNSDTRPT